MLKKNTKAIFTKIALQLDRSALVYVVQYRLNNYRPGIGQQMICMHSPDIFSACQYNQKVLSPVVPELDSLISN